MSDVSVKKKGSFGHTFFVILGAILCVIFAAMLICNVTIIVKGTINPATPPSVFGVTPLVVLSGSMSGDAPDHIEVGDLIFVGSVDTADLGVGDVITYMQEGSAITHRIIDIKTEEGKLLFYTKGDANNSADRKPVEAENVVGIFKGRIPKVGDFALFLQEPLGMVLFIGVPLLLFIIYDIIRRQRYAAKEDKKTGELEAELERLRRLAGERADASPVTAAPAVPDASEVPETPEASNTPAESGGTDTAGE